MTGDDFTTVAFTISQPFYELLELEAEERGTTVEEWIKTTCWVMAHRQAIDKTEPIEPEIELPDDVARRAELIHEHWQVTGKDTSIGEAISEVAEFRPRWVIGGEPVED